MTGQPFSPDIRAGFRTSADAGAGSRCYTDICTGLGASRHFRRADVSFDRLLQIVNSFRFASCLFETERVSLVGQVVDLFKAATQDFKIASCFGYARNHFAEHDAA